MGQGGEVRRPQAGVIEPSRRKKFHNVPFGKIFAWRIVMQSGNIVLDSTAGGNRGRELRQCLQCAFAAMNLFAPNRD